MDIVLRFISDRNVLLLDNCEHLLDSCGELAVALLGGCPRLTVLTTSREPIGIAAEVSWRVPRPAATSRPAPKSSGVKSLAVTMVPAAAAGMVAFPEPAVTS